MARGRPLGVRAEVLLGLALVTLIAVLSTGLLALWASGASLRVERESTALGAATAAAIAVAAAGAPPGGSGLVAGLDRGRVAAVLARLGGHGARVELQVLGPDRKVLAAFPPRRPDDWDPPVALGVASGLPSVLQYRARPADGVPELLVYAPVLVGGRSVGAVRASIPAPEPVLEALDRSGWLLLALAIGNAILVLALGAFVLTRLVVQPLRAVERATTRVRAGDWEQRIVAEGPREVAALADAFNQMTASLAEQREQLIRTEKLASVGQLAAGVAHEIGNPLAAVLGYVDLLKSDTGTLPEWDRRDILARLKTETQRIHRIIQDLLAYSRPAREEARPTDPLGVLRGTLGLLAPQARFRGVNVELVPAEGGAEALISPERLTQVLVNLLLNAADAMGGKGTIRAACARLDGRVVLTIADEGPGVPAELRRKIFDPFFTTKEPGQGTGLGLSISRSIVESYGGTLELASSERGARFVLSLLAAEAPAG